MNDHDKLIFQRIPEIPIEELTVIQLNTKDFDEEKITQFLNLYIGRRVKSDTILICTIIGFIGIGGIQRFITGQIGMGILYLLTFGLCYIGTIVDLINYKKLTLERNQEIIVQEVIPMLYNSFREILVRIVTASTLIFGSISFAAFFASLTISLPPKAITVR